MDVTTVKKSQAIEEVLQKFPGATRSQLIPILQEVQQREGFLSRDGMIQIGEHLDLPVSKIYGVATFYNQFKFKAPGRNHIMLCRGTACHVKGSQTVLEMVEETLGIKAGDTTDDGLFSLEVVACIGACGLAPVISVNGEFYANVDSKSVKQIIKDYQKKEMMA
jgi:NADH-quinone oxidoreductase subunit E